MFDIVVHRALRLTMYRLTLADCASFFRPFHAGLVSVGLIQPIDAFAEHAADPLRAALTSLAKALRGGATLEEALESMSPRFPLGVEEILVLATAGSVLDLAVDDLARVHESQGDDDDAALDALGRLLDDWRDRPSSGVICRGCLERELDRLLRRADTEGATEVLVTQRAEQHLVQVYIGAKPVRVSEPAESRTYETLKRELQSAAAAGTLRLGDADLPARVLGDGVELDRGDRTLWVRFPNA